MGIDAANRSLAKLLVQRSYLRGDFVLASGRRSTTYFDCRLTTTFAEAMPLIGAAFVREFRRAGTNPVSVGGLTMGADPIALATGMHSFKANPSAPLQPFVVRKAPKSHGQTKLIEGNFKSGDKVVVIDDVVTKGDSTIAAIEAVKREGGDVAFVVVLVDRQQGGREKIEALGYKVVSAFTKDDLLARD